MTQLNTMENVNFVALTDEELMEMEGGFIDPFTAGMLVGGTITVGAALWSMYKSRK